MSIVSNRKMAKAKQWTKQQIPTVLTLVLFIALWWVVANVINNNRIFASISYTISSLQEHTATISVKIMQTLSSVVVAFILAVLLGVILGLLVAEIYSLRQMTMPMVIFGYAVPHPAVAPLFIIWFLVGGDIVLLSFTGPSAFLFSSVESAEAQLTFAINGVSVFGAWVGFFPVFISTVTGMNQLDERFEHLGTVLGATRWQMVKYFRFWGALPNIASSIKSAVQLSIVGVIVAEFLAASSGIGYQIVLAWKNADLGYMYGVVLVIMIGSYLFYQIVVWTMKFVTPPGSVS